MQPLLQGLPCGVLLLCPSPCSLLSHSAVVARELGLPTIVGVSGGLMKRLKVRGQPCPLGAGHTHKPLDTSLSVVALPSPLP